MAEGKLRDDASVDLHLMEFTQAGSIQTLAILFDRSNAMQSKARFDLMLSHLEEKRGKFKNDRQFLQYVFRYVHRKSLKTYKQYVTLDQTLSKTGFYDCLTGTLLYGHLLEKLGYQIVVREFRYHVLLIVQQPDGEIMFESTDPLNGFVEGSTAIADRIAEYKKMDDLKECRALFNITNTIDNHITLRELTGLHFYNQAIYFLNKKDIDSARSKIRKALALYPSRRVTEVTSLIYDNELKSILLAGE
ncbi:MAG: hypothetical protein AAFO69_08665 [Bacteroidota bacterium]